jgi:hypothetical protein
MPCRPARGQALVWFLALLATGLASLFAVYNVGQVSVAKQKAVNAADAGALAGAAEQARLLNLMAYGNRAMVATDALAAQMVSLDAWLQYVHTATRNLGTVSQLVPYVGQVVGHVLQQVSQQIGRVESVYGTQALPAAVAGFEGLKRALARSSEVAHQAGGPLANAAAANVVAAHRTVPRDAARAESAPVVLGGVFAVNEQAWRDFSVLYAGDDRQRTRQVVRDSLDDFTVARHGNALTNLSLAAVRLEKRGGTRLMGFERWEAQDTWDLRLLRSDRTMPVGWGRADVGGGGHLRWGGTSAQVLAFHNRRDIADTAAHRWSGIAAVRDLAPALRAASGPPELTFLLAAAKPRADVPTTTTLGVATADGGGVLGSPGLPDRLLADQVSALAAARVYFERPQRGIGDWTAEAWAGQSTLFREDGAKEYASLYNPFWHASLAPVGAAPRAALLEALGAPAGLVAPAATVAP